VPASPDRYRIHTAIGAGGMGEVYRGTDTVLQRPVAIKFLSRDSGGSAPAQVLAEARIASALSHPNVCTIYEVTETDGQPCIVMEYVEGQPLSTLIPPDAGLPIDTIVSYGIQIVDALTHAHDSGIVHRDLKSANIIITPQQRVKLLDFGLAVQDADTSVDDETSTLDGWPSNSEPGTPGTLRYMAPELLRGAHADRQSDLWAVGAVLYEMAAGKRPFDGRTPHEISAAILTQAPEPLPPRVPSALRSIINRCLSKDRARRYQSAAEVRAALEALQLETQVGRAQSSIGRRQTALLGLIVLGIVVVALGQGSWELLKRKRVASEGFDARASVPAVDDAPSTYVAVVPIIDPATSLKIEALTETAVESLIDRIADVSLPHVKVIALPTAMQFRKKAGDPVATAGEELHAEYVITIRLSKRDERLTLSAALNDARDRSQMWGHVYEMTSRDIFGIQAKVAAQIVDTLSQRLAFNPQPTDADRRKFAREPTQDYSALELYALGRHFWYMPTATAAGYQKSLAFYQAAIKRDSNYALAYLGIADTVASMAWEGWIPPPEAHKKISEALAVAVRLDPGLGQTHYTRATLALMEKDWTRAEAEHRAAIAAVPSSPINRRFYSFFLIGRGRTKEAVAVLDDAVARDPEGFATNLASATTRYWTADLDGAIMRLNETIAIDPSDPATAAAHEILGDVYESKGRLPQAISERQQALRMNGAADEADALGRDYAQSGFEVAMHR
jgi:eukaryotic-like serine/threonine-protein kinase